MIVELAVEALLGLLTLILEAIPDGSLPSVAATALEQFADVIGGALGGLDGILPITEVAVFVGWALGTYVPIAVTYQVSHWIWTHLPIIGNGA